MQRLFIPGVLEEHRAVGNTESREARDRQVRYQVGIPVDAVRANGAYVSEGDVRQEKHLT